MKLKLTTSCIVSKKMSTTRQKGGGEDALVTCTISVKGIVVNREQLDELAGWPIGIANGMFNEMGIPFTRTSFLFPQRALLCEGTIEHRRESGAALATLKLTKTVASSLRFNLDAPNEQGPTARMSCVLLWKAAGDEVDDIRDLLSHTCFMEMTFKEEPVQQPLFADAKSSVKAETAAGDRAKLDRKRKAAGEKETDNDHPDPDAMNPPPIGPAEAVVIDQPDPLLEAGRAYFADHGGATISQLQRHLKIGYNRAARMLERFRSEILDTPAAEAKKGSSMADIEREATELAKRHPRRDRPETRKH